MFLFTQQRTSSVKYDGQHVLNLLMNNVERTMENRSNIRLKPNFAYGAFDPEEMVSCGAGRF